MKKSVFSAAILARLGVLVAVVALAGCGSNKDSDSAQGGASSDASACATVKDAKAKADQLNRENPATVEGQLAKLNELEAQSNRMEPFAGRRLDCGSEVIVVKGRDHFEKVRQTVAEARKKIEKYLN